MEGSGPAAQDEGLPQGEGHVGDDEERAYVERVESELNAEIERVLKEPELEPEVILEDV